MKEISRIKNPKIYLDLDSPKMVGLYELSFFTNRTFDPSTSKNSDKDKFAPLFYQVYEDISPGYQSSMTPPLRNHPWTEQQKGQEKMDQWCGERLSQEAKTYDICKSKIWRPTARKAILLVSPILDLGMSQKVESLVVCGWIENSNHNNGQYRRTTTAGIHQKIPRESIASPKGTMRWDGITALFQCAEAPGRWKILGFSY